MLAPKGEQEGAERLKRSRRPWKEAKTLEVQPPRTLRRKGSGMFQTAVRATREVSQGHESTARGRRGISTLDAKSAKPAPREKSEGEIVPMKVRTT